VPQLENALVNLAVNARDAMPAGGVLGIETANTRLDEDYAAHNIEARPGDYVMLSVADTGMGMDPDVAARAFEPFFTTKPAGHGTGLGLSMVYGFVKQSEGHIKIYSEPGIGTVVKLYLPRADADAEAAAPARRSGAAPTGLETVLAVEDNEQVLRHVVSQLNGLGYTVIKAANGADALKLLAENPAIDLLFTDLVMPGGLDGHQLMLRARELRPGLKVLFTSGYTENILTRQGRFDPEQHLLSKPYERADLARALRKVLDS
jgi:CheY-like chemotaxis protein